MPLDRLRGGWDVWWVGSPGTEAVYGHPRGRPVYNRPVNALVSLAATAVLAWLGLTGGDVRLDALEVGGYYSAGEGGVVWVHPTWVVDVPYGHPVLNGRRGMAWGNVAVVATTGASEPYARWIVEHELAHTRQFRALGWALFVLAPIDAWLGNRPFNFEGQASDHTFALTAMWAPPLSWPPLWSWISFGS